MLPTFLTWSLIIKSRHGLLIMDFINNKATINGITEKVELLRKTKLVKEGSLQEKTAYKITLHDKRMDNPFRKYIW